MTIVIASPECSIVAEWTQEAKDHHKYYHFVLNVGAHGVQDLMDSLSEQFGMHGVKWKWDSQNDHGNLKDTTITIVFRDYEDAVLFKLVTNQS